MILLVCYARFSRLLVHYRDGPMRSFNQARPDRATRLGIVQFKREDYCKASSGWVIQGGSRSQKGKRGRKRGGGEERTRERGREGGGCAARARHCDERGRERKRVARRRGDTGMI